MAAKVIGAKLALFVGDKLVSLQRDDTPGLLWAGYWDLPGGGHEGDESPLTCALRETREELSISVPRGAVTWGREYASSSGDIVWFFAGRVPPTVADDIVLGDEGQGWKLFSVADFLADDQVVPQFKPRLRDYLAGVASGRFS